MTASQMTEEFKSTPLATRIIGGLAGIIICIFGWWCVRVTTQLDMVIQSVNANEKLAETVRGHTQYLQQIYASQNETNQKVSSNSIKVDGLVKDMDIVKAKLFK